MDTDEDHPQIIGVGYSQIIGGIYPPPLLFVSSKVFGIKKIRGFWGKGFILMLPLNYFGDFFGKNGSFCNLKENYIYRFSKQFEKIK